MLRRSALLFLVAAGAGCLQAPPDSSELPDAKPPDDDGAPSSAACDDVFGQVADYKLCIAEQDSCRFYTRFLEGDDFTCAMVCAEFAVACLDGFSDTEMDDKCEVAEQVGCASQHEDQICVCARP